MEVLEAQVTQAAESNDGPFNNLRKCFEELREMIIHGHLAPGSRVMEVELAEQLGFSRTPVRGALHMLERDGYLIKEAIGGRKQRLIVAPVTKDDGVELFWIVGRLEGLAARSAATLEPPVKSRILTSMTAWNDALRQFADQGQSDTTRLFELDIAFHQTIFDVTGQRLRSLHQSVKPQVERYLRVYASAIVDQLRTSIEEHDSIIGAIENGDPDTAERAIQLNWESGSRRLAKVIDTLGERGIWRKRA